MQQSRISAFFKPSGDRRLKDKGEAESKARRDSSRILKKKRSYAQYHLELGQSDFLLHSCSVCGMMYACGDESDEKLHRDFHKKYYEGIQFKVKEVLTIMEKELGFSDGQLLNKQCKVYLFISSYRVVGCLVAESIRMGHRVIENSASRKHTDHNNTYSDKMCQNLERKGPILQFGGISFKRVVIKRSDGKNKASIDECETGAVLCEEESVPALCGFRGIWVVPSQRRKQIASRLLDAARQSFSPGRILEHSQCAFSPPTSSGRALASRYCSGSAYLIYREEDV
ncbi:protein CHROMOSOME TRANSMISSION FIDELITY 7-like isoform X2 [Zingiber officinale]|uniref:protein CHROMOSOME TRANSMISSION FIDELITY 7-like isoform X2 n=1 Tax=Zingiber officinale TaxID=94328 RepID=UPI001C4DA0D6|nr:protein CHROMOSOME TRANSMISSION FIDELITY 7-like isoform X2 [Zingiber officinale]